MIVPPRHEAGKIKTGPHPQLEVIDRDECLRLLAGDEIGRLAVIAGNTPVVLPVNYALDGETVVFRCDPGTKLDRGPRARASFEVDCFDRERHTGWSVVATGRLEEVTRYDAATFDRVRRLSVDPWACGDKAHWMRLIPDRVTGLVGRVEVAAMSPRPVSAAVAGIHSAVVFFVDDGQLSDAEGWCLETGCRPAGGFRTIGPGGVSGSNGAMWP